MSELIVNRELPFAVTWTVAEPMERSSHALAVDGRVWLIDPVLDEAALLAAKELGDVVAVIQLLDRHPRGCQMLAARYGVPHLRLPELVADSPFELFDVVSVPGWRERGLWWPEVSLLVVPEAVGSCGYFAAGRRLGVHPLLRMLPPRKLGELSPGRLLVGHGPPLHEGAAEAMGEALDRSRRDAPRAALEAIKAFRRGP